MTGKELFCELTPEEKRNLFRRFYLVSRKLERIVIRTPAYWKKMKDALSEAKSHYTILPFVNGSAANRREVRNRLLNGLGKLIEMNSALVENFSPEKLHAVKREFLGIVPYIRLVRLEHSKCVEIAEGLRKGLERLAVFGQGEYSDRVEKEFRREYGYILPQVEPEEIEELIGESRELREIITRGYYRLVVSICANYYRQNPYEYFADGYEGMIKALERYNPFSGQEFTTFAHYWISQKVARAVWRGACTVSVSVSLQGKDRKTPYDYVSTVSLSRPLPDTDLFLIEALKNPDEVPVEEMVEKKVVFEQVLKAVNRLRSEERAVILLYLEGVTFKEMARRGIKNPRGCYRRAIEKLRTFLGVNVEKGIQQGRAFEEAEAGRKGKGRGVKGRRAGKAKAGSKKGDSQLYAGELFDTELYR